MCPRGLGRIRGLEDAFAGPQFQELSSSGRGSHIIIKDRVGIARESSSGKMGSNSDRFPCSVLGSWIKREGTERRVPVPWSALGMRGGFVLRCEEGQMLLQDVPKGGAKAPVPTIGLSQVQDPNTTSA
jgi:hypothetical protein